MTDPRTPCVVGVAQKTYREEAGGAPEPLDQWEEMSRLAALDSGGSDVLNAVDSLQVVYSMSWQYDDPPARLAERLGLGDVDRFYSGISGTTSQQLVSKASAEILVGGREMVLIASGEALATKKRLKKQGAKPEWSHPPLEKRGMPFSDPFHPAEMAHRVFQAYLTFAIFDVARRAKLGIAPDANRQQAGEMLARMTSIAAKNPDAWFRNERSASELIEVSATNRMVAYPYTKNMVSIMDVDMAAAILVTSHGKADALGIPLDRRISLRGWGSAQDPVYVAERDDLGRSLAMEVASREALTRAGVGIDEIEFLDLYSCFASSINFARDALGIANDDSRPLTLTGGLPYFGGPGNGYMSHAIVAMIKRLRETPTAYGIVSGVGMHMQNHVFGVYSGIPGEVAVPDEAGVQARMSTEKARTITNRATGPATLASYSVVHKREGRDAGVAICDLPDGSRCYARVEGDDMLDSMERQEWVGREVELTGGEGEVNLIRDSAN
jgi:acetyl-CoA C-acetyltransferase